MSKSYWKALHFFSYALILVFGGLIAKNKFDLYASKPASGKSNLASQRPGRYVDKSFVRRAPASVETKISAGYFKESSNLKACVLYMQGASQESHTSYLNQLADAGYRVLVYDEKETSIGGNESRETAQAVWENVGGADCASSKKLAIGWSQSRPAVYHLATEKKLDAVVLASPGVDVKWNVKDSAYPESKIDKKDKFKTLPQQAQDAVEFFNKVVAR